MTLRKDTMEKGGRKNEEKALKVVRFGPNTF